LSRGFSGHAASILDRADIPRINHLRAALPIISNMKPVTGNHPHHKTFIRAGIAALLVVAGIAYLLADRYLIDHVEIAGVSAYPAPAAGETTAPAESSTGSGSGGTGISSVDAEDAAVAQVFHTAGGSVEASSAQAAPDPSAVVYSDDWNYQSADLSIAISEVTTGSGSGKVTYFVADVQLADAQQLQNAFAEDTFGRNVVADTSEIARENGAIFAVNGDYYGYRTDGIIIRNGVIYRDEPARTGLVFFTDGTMRVYDETQTGAQELLAAGAWNTLSFGPGLLVDGAVVENIARVAVDSNLGNHPIQGEQPRTGVGIINANHFVFVVVDGRSEGYSRGVTLTEFAQIFKELGCSEAYNLDGGGSSTMYFMGRVVNNPLGRGRERGTSDILMVGE